MRALDSPAADTRASAEDTWVSVADTWVSTAHTWASAADMWGSVADTRVSSQYWCIHVCLYQTQSHRVSTKGRLLRFVMVLSYDVDLFAKFMACRS